MLRITLRNPVTFNDGDEQLAKTEVFGTWATNNPTKAVENHTHRAFVIQGYKFMDEIALLRKRVAILLPKDDVKTIKEVVV